MIQFNTSVTIFRNIASQFHFVVPKLPSVLASKYDLGRKDLKGQFQEISFDIRNFSSQHEHVLAFGGASRLTGEDNGKSGY